MRAYTAARRKSPPRAGRFDVDTAAGTDRIRIEQLRALFQTAPLAMGAAQVAALLLAGTLAWGFSTPRDGIALWLGAVGLDAAVRQTMCWRWRRDVERDAHARLWARRMTWASMAGGLLWGVGMLVLIPPGQLVQELLVLLVVSAVASGSVPTFGAYRPAAFAFFLPAILPYGVWAALQGDPFHVGLAALDAVYAGVLVWLSLRVSADLERAIRLRFDNETLATDLARQKAEVEAASLAKSQFLAAASHDLRQPVHALGLFVGALERMPLPREAHEIVAHMGASTRGLDHLFSALFDISRLDAGVVGAVPRAFPLGPLIERLCREFRAESEAAGLDLRCRWTAMWAMADPLLVERVLRNFLANAIRHAGRHGVLVGVRRGGDRVRLMVYDRGPGIAPEMHDKVFEEFFQLGNPARDRRQGLGLGLAITRRLARLMACPIRLASVPGRGSAFGLELPLAPPDVHASAAETTDRVSTGRFIAVVDDEAEIRVAMHEMLSRWGHRVCVAGSGDALLAALAAEPEVPALLLADYRLAHGENGLDLADRLREAYNVEIPVLIVTGDTAPDRLREASERGYRLLHKPVRPYLLERALVDIWAESSAS